ncbi:MAG: hypothetical protein HZB30_11375 [Nitrospirae bacterium]|nr:hypothetical protein [Nitrospirota bacterium]
MRILEPTVLEKLYRELPVEIGAEIKSLLETKHLYQNLELHPKIISEITKVLKGTDQSLKYIAQKYLEIAAGFWRLPSYTGIMPSTSSLLELSLNTIKVFCTSCERIEPFHSSGQTFYRNKIKQLERITPAMEAGIPVISGHGRIF